ncbi:uncharacterized protein METZ01_LOCUS177643 [marine metagenome]|uniref:Uncharacterized protein n=1 Tax=marine metagenome TaxID=408172 RepID=A0A382CG22_9ZZZZ
MKRILNFRAFWICMALVLCFFVARIVIITSDISDFISDFWK